MLSLDRNLLTVILHDARCYRYGDLVPTTEAGKIFAVLYSFVGISIIGAMLGYIGGGIIEAERRVVTRTQNAARAAFMELFAASTKGRTKAKDNALRDNTISKGGVNPADKCEGTLPEVGALRRICCHLLPWRLMRQIKSLVCGIVDTFRRCYYIFVPFIMLALYVGKVEGWTLATSLYYAIATASTVGYGDCAPTSTRMRLVSLIFIPFAVISLGEILGRIAKYFIENETLRAEKEFMERSFRMTLADLQDMDVNNDGKFCVARLCFYLLCLSSSRDLLGILQSGIDNTKP